MLTTTLCLEPSSLKSLFESSAAVTVADEAPMGIVTDVWVLEDDGSALESVRALQPGYDRGDFSCLQVDSTLIVVRIGSRGESSVRRKDFAGNGIHDVRR